MQKLMGCSTPFKWPQIQGVEIDRSGRSEAVPWNGCTSSINSRKTGHIASLQGPGAPGKCMPQLRAGGTQPVERGDKQPLKGPLTATSQALTQGASIFLDCSPIVSVLFPSPPAIFMCMHESGQAASVVASSFRTRRGGFSHLIHGHKPKYGEFSIPTGSFYS